MNANELAAYALVFTATAAAAFLGLAVVTLFRRVEDDPAALEPVPRLFGPLTPVLAGLLPTTARGRASIQLDLLRAGYFEPVALVNFLAVRSLLTYVPLVAGEVGAILTADRLSAAFLVVGVVAGILGYALPRLMLAFAASRRTDEIRRGLPMLMDTLGLVLSTGASLTGGLARAGETIRRGYPELSREVRVVVAHGRLRSLAHALDRWKDRMPIPELGSFVYLLGQADRLGTDITRGLWELSASLQATARQRAEAAANRANFYMIFPTVLCLLAAAALILAGPGIVQLIESTRQVDQILKEGEAQTEKLRREAEAQGKAPPPTTTLGQPQPPGQ